MSGGDRSQKMVGNALCLDFVNTVDTRPAYTRDDLATTTSAWDWAAAAGIAAARGRRPASARVLAELRALRETTHAVFSAIADDGAPDVASLRALIDVHGESLRTATWQRRERVMVPVWSLLRDLSEAVGPVSDSAVILLRTGPLDRIGRCPKCGWLFVDVSRNGRRRWCSMATCGSRDKAARYFARK